MREKFFLLPSWADLAPEQAWRLASALYAQPQSLVQGSAALVAVHAVCLFRTGCQSFFPFAAASLVVMALRLAECAWFRRARRKAQSRDARTARHWARRFAAGACLTAALWGGTDIFVLGRFNDPTLQFFVLMVQAGWVGHAGVRNVASPVAVAGQALLTLLPSLAGILLAQDRFALAALPFILVHLAATLGTARHLGEQLAGSMEAERRLAAANTSLQLLSATDGLTGIGNRRAFDSTLQVEWARAAREASDIALIMVDVDCFKLYNDQYGHLAGDDCLRAVAALVQGALRRPPDFAARFGGEAFATLLPATGEAGARDVAERVRSAVQSAAMPHNATPLGCVTVSIGVASMAPPPGHDPQTLIALADRALHEAKQCGRNQVRAATDLLQLDSWRMRAPAAADAPPVPKGLEVLVFESDALVASLLGDMLADIGCAVCGPCLTAAASLSLIEAAQPRIALLDLSLSHADASYAVADALAARGVPFAFVTADGGGGLRADFHTRPVLQKPFAFPVLVRLVGELATHAAPQP